MGRLSALLVVALLLAISGCDGDDDDNGTTAVSTPTETETTVTQTAPEPEEETEAETQPEVETETEIETETSPEDQPGGAGDEEPARSQALFTASGGRVTPRVVRVPSFIAVRVELRARDGGPYTLRIGGQTLEAGGALSSASGTLDGLRPGDSYVGRLSGGASGTVRVSATAEPGP